MTRVTVHRRAAGRHVYNLVTGFALLFYVFGTSTLFLLAPAAWTYLIMLGVRESCATLVWLVVFSTMIAWCTPSGVQKRCRCGAQELDWACVITV